MPGPPPNANRGPGDSLPGPDTGARSHTRPPQGIAGQRGSRVVRGRRFRRRSADARAMAAAVRETGLTEADFVCGCMPFEENLQ